MYLLQFLKRCDEIYMMNAGKIVEHGTHEDLMRLDREYASMVKNSTIVTEDNLSAYVFIYTFVHILRIVRKQFSRPSLLRSVKATEVTQRNNDDSTMRTIKSAHPENYGKEKLYKGACVWLYNIF